MRASRTILRRWTGVVLASTAALAIGLGPTAASAAPETPAPATPAPEAPAAPTTADEAADLVTRAGQELSQLDEQVHQAQLTVTAMQDAARQADADAAAAAAQLAQYEPQLRAIAQAGYTTSGTSRVALFLTSDSAADLVEQMTTLQLIADHTDALLVDVSAAERAASAAQAQADSAEAAAVAALTTLQQQQAEVQGRIDAYEADYQRLSAAEQAAVRLSLAGPVLDTPSTASVVAQAPSDVVATILATALDQVGDPYVWGAAGPNGFDCSGLTQFAYAAAGISLPHSSRAQSQMGSAVSRAQLQPGDLVYFYSPVSHVGIYIGNGQMVHARENHQPVAVTSVDMGGYAGARRVLG